MYFDEKKGRKDTAKNKRKKANERSTDSYLKAHSTNTSPFFL